VGVPPIDVLESRPRNYDRNQGLIAVGLVALLTVLVFFGQAVAQGVTDEKSPTGWSQARNFGGGPCLLRPLTAQGGHLGGGRYDLPQRESRSRERPSVHGVATQRARNVHLVSVYARSFVEESREQD
jgi:hypothetical protein